MGHETHGLLLREIKNAQQALQDLTGDVCSRQESAVSECAEEVRRLASAVEETSAQKPLVEDMQRRQGDLERTMTEEFRKVRAAIGAGLAALGTSGQLATTHRQHLEGCALPGPPSKGTAPSGHYHIHPQAHERPPPCSDRVLHRV